MSDVEQAVSNEPDGSPKPENPGGEAAQVNQPEGDDINAALSEYDNEVNRNQPAPSTPSHQSEQEEEVSVRLQRLEREQQDRIYRTDMDAACDTIRGDLPADRFDNQFLEGWLNARAMQDKRILRAWEDRSNDPAKFKRVLTGLAKELAGKWGDYSGVDQDATSTRDAVAAAMKGGTTKAPEGKPPELGKMTDAQLREFTQKEYGFSF